MGPGDEERLRRLYEAHAAVLLAYATRLTGGDRQRAEDIVQETLVRAWRHPEATGGGPSERGWLLTVARNIAIDDFRARKVRPQVVADVDPEVGRTAVAEDDIERAVEAWTLAEAVATLRPEQRAVLVETYYRGRSVAETAAVLGIPVGTVKSRAFHALRALRARLVETGVRV